MGRNSVNKQYDLDKSGKCGIILCTYTIARRIGIDMDNKYLLELRPVVMEMLPKWRQDSVPLHGLLTYKHRNALPCGVYMVFDHNEVVYVGATRQPVIYRLLNHKSSHSLLGNALRGWTYGYSIFVFENKRYRFAILDGKWVLSERLLIYTLRPRFNRACNPDYIPSSALVYSEPVGFTVTLQVREILDQMAAARGCPLSVVCREIVDLGLERIMGGDYAAKNRQALLAGRA